MEKNKKGNKGGGKNDKNDKGGKGGKSDSKGDDKLKTCNFVKARHILCSKQGQIEEIFKNLNEAHGSCPPTQEFAKLAEEHSECPSKKRGGQLGFFTRAQMAGAFSEAAFNTPPGQMSGIVKTAHGYHLILVEDRKASIK